MADLMQADFNMARRFGQSIITCDFPNMMRRVLENDETTADGCQSLAPAKR